ncbi:MAG: hypothetical protein N3C60_06035 [Calditerrivibrio sp.]|nr:hypothetical protein [Calditerrivibrio sp.]
MVKKDLIDIYGYFSHNLRTCTSTIVATLEALKTGIISIDDEEMNSVYESAYIIDILDVSLNILIDHILQKKIYDSEYEVNIKTIVEKFLEEQKSLITLQEVTVNIEAVDCRISKSGYILKYLLQLIIFEVIKISSNNLEIEISQKSLNISIEEARDAFPNIFKIIKDIFSKHGITFEYTKNNLIVEF